MKVGEKQNWKRCGWLSRILLAGLVFAWAALPMDVSACSACFGETGSPMAKGLSMGVLFLIGVVLVVLGGVVTFFIYLARRARAAAREPEELGIPIFSAEHLAPLGD